MENKIINKKMSFAEIIQRNSDAIEVLLGKGMHCIGCLMAMYESLEDGAASHGLDADELVDEINGKIKKKGKKTETKRMKAK